MGVDESSKIAHARMCVCFGNACRVLYLQICKLLLFVIAEELVEEI
jgi:hypothetical protein